MAKKNKPDMRAIRSEHKKKAARLQYGALCYRNTEKGLRILLITSRRTRRWIGPKGWPIKKKSPHEVAAIEALEEAGVRGTVAKRSIGFFTYRKDIGGGKHVRCTVQVFPMEVTDAMEDYPERHQRQRKWMKPKKAAKWANPPEFGRLIKKFESGFES